MRKVESLVGIEGEKRIKGRVREEFNRTKGTG